jgi:hypothetical protein
MSKFITISLTIITVLLIGVAFFGTVNSRNNKWQQMPDSILYEIYISGNTWPDRCYTSTYEKIDSETIYFPEGYWVFEPSKHPLGSVAWVFHSSETKGDKDHRYTITDITAVIKK